MSDTIDPACNLLAQSAVTLAGEEMDELTSAERGAAGESPAVERLRTTLPASDELPVSLAAWVGASYAEGQCWDFMRDAFRELHGVILPESYYDALPLFVTVHDARQSKAFTPEPWDVVMLRTHPFLILHCAIVIDAERFIHPWGESGLVISRFDDQQFVRKVAGFLRIVSDRATSES